MPVPFIEQEAVKVASGEALNADELQRYRDWFRSTSALINGLFNRSGVSGNVDNLSEITPKLGSVYAGEFITPKDGATSFVPTDTGFTGSFMAAQGYAFNSVNYKVGSVAAGVLGVGFNEDGQLVFGAGAGSLSVTGMGLQALEFPGATVVEWLTDDTAAQVGSMLGWYVSNASGLYVLGKGKSASHFGRVGMAAMAYNDALGDYKSFFEITELGVGEFDFTNYPVTAGAGGLTIKSKTTATNVLNEILFLVTETSGTPAAGLGTALGFYVQNSTGVEKQVGYLQFAYSNVTNGSEAASFAVNVIKAGSIAAAFSHDGSTFAVTGDLNVSGLSRIGGNASPPLRLGQKLSVDVSANFGGMALTTWSTANNAPILDFNSSRSNAMGTHTVVANGNFLGVLDFLGSDGTGFINGARIIASVDGTPGTNDMPGKLAFFTTPDGSATAVERITIKSTGNVGINTTGPASRLDIGAGALTVSEMTAPSAPAANGCVVYAEDNGAGKTRLMALFSSGAAQQIAIQP